MSFEERREQIKGISPDDMATIREYANEKFYLNYIDDIYQIHKIISTYCQDNSLPFYNYKSTNFNNMFNVIKRNSSATKEIYNERLSQHLHDRNPIAMLSTSDIDHDYQQNSQLIDDY